MMMRSVREPQILMNVRSCCRCGKEFSCLGERVRVCETCRRPRKQPRLRVVAGEKLSLRERQVAALVARGLPNKLIASQLHLTEGTIKVYLFHIFQKTKVNNRTELAMWQVRGGLAMESPAS